MQGIVQRAQHPAERAAERHARAWVWLVVGLAAHVADEALTGFLDVYNPAVLQVRERLGWFPAPTFEFGPWLSLLILAIVLLALLAPSVRRGMAGTRAASWIFGAVMLVNGIGHLAGSALFHRWLPGATSSPLLIVAAVLLLLAAQRRARPAPSA
jgi:hypothetical protein